MTALAETRLLLARGLRAGLRTPMTAFALSIIIPLALLSLTSQTFRQITRLPGFPGSNYANWETPGIVMLTAMAGAGYAATSLVIDIQSGFLDRLRLLDMRAGSLLMSQLLFDVARALPAGLAILALGVALGAEINEGVLGVVALFALLGLWSVAYGGLFFIVALRTKNPQAPLALAPLFLPLQFLSTLFIPEAYLPGWVKAISEVNPFTYMVEAARALTTGPFDFGAVWHAVLVAVATLIVTQLAARRAFRRAVGA